MKHLAALGIKYVMTFVVLLAFMSLGIGAGDESQQLALVVVNYLIGDLVILPAYGSTVGVAVVTLSAVISIASVHPQAALLFRRHHYRTLIGLAEHFFHRFVKEAILCIRPRLDINGIVPHKRGRDDDQGGS